MSEGSPSEMARGLLVWGFGMPLDAIVGVPTTQTYLQQRRAEEYGRLQRVFHGRPSK